MLLGAKTLRGGAGLRDAVHVDEATALVRVQLGALRLLRKGMILFVMMHLFVLVLLLCHGTRESCTAVKTFCLGVRALC